MFKTNLYSQAAAEQAAYQRGFSDGRRGTVDVQRAKVDDIYAEGVTAGERGAR